MLAPHFDKFNNGICTQCGKQNVMFYVKRVSLDFPLVMPKVVLCPDCEQNRHDLESKNS